MPILRRAGVTPSRRNARKGVGDEDDQACPEVGVDPIRWAWRWKTLQSLRYVLNLQVTGVSVSRSDKLKRREALGHATTAWATLVSGNDENDENDEDDEKIVWCVQIWVVFQALEYQRVP